MARVRHVRIDNFRGVRSLSWFPQPGFNCLIGQGDSGKSTVLDAIDLCLGARRSISFSDADFHGLDVGRPIRVEVTIGDLEHVLLNLDVYGMYLRSFDAGAQAIDDEPDAANETVLTVRLLVESDLEPSWDLYSERAEAEGRVRNLSWGDRVRLAPTRIGVGAGFHLSWRHGSVLNKVSDERLDVSATLAQLVRDARRQFAEDPGMQVDGALRTVTDTARELGIPVGERATVTLDADSLSLGGGTVSLHDESGVPLKSLGTGSVRLMVAGLQRAVARSPIVIMDEVEYGLEPHRIVRLLDSLGAKETEPPLQAFMTTHSPVVVRELTGDQLFVVRVVEGVHELMRAGREDGVQGALRRYPEAFLAASVLVCEGATEVGFIRGLDQHRQSDGGRALAANGVALVDANGVDNVLWRAAAFQALGYRTAVLRDDDKSPPPEDEEAFIERGGVVVKWRPGRRIEEELFLSLGANAVLELVDLAAAQTGAEVISANIKSASSNKYDLEAVRTVVASGSLDDDVRRMLAVAATPRNAGWFKSVTKMEEAAWHVIGPSLSEADEEFQGLVDSTFAWIDSVT